MLSCMPSGRNRKNANGEGWNLPRLDGRRDVGLHVLTPEGVKRVRTTKRTREEGDIWLTEQKARRNLGLGATKTGKARVVSVGAKLAAQLRDHRRRQLEERLAVGQDAVGEWEFVFTDAAGKVLGQRRSGREFRALCRAAGLPESVRFHDLRHTATTLHLLDGTPAKLVQEMLGHHSIKQTLDTYSHVLPNMQKEAAARMDSMLF
jgi:integrase